MSNTFQTVPVLDNFYQTSSFYPMPVVMVTTVSDSGETNIGSYSLCFPFGIAENHCMMLISRYDSNTATNIRQRKHVALNFIPDNTKYLKNAVILGYPGESTTQKLKDSIFTLLPPQRRNTNNVYPKIIAEAVQVMECTWIEDQSTFHYNGSGGEQHFLLRIENLLMKPRWYSALKRGGIFPKLPIDYGYRDSKNFWFAKHSKPFRIPIPKGKGITVDTIKYQADRMPYDLEWEEEAYQKLCKVPRIFLKRVLESICERAVSEGETKVTPELLEKYHKKH